MKYLYLISLILLFPVWANAQTCEGPALLDEEFENGIPGNWTVLNLDTNTLQASMINKGFTGQWQPFTRLSRKSVANSCYFVGNGSADDYLISPAVTLGSGPICLSWMGCQQFSFFSDGYEVLISTTVPTPAAFQSNAPLAVVAPEQALWTEHAVSLSAYAGQTVYIAFWYNNQQGTGYALHLDAVRISNPVSRDAMVKSLNLKEVVAPGNYPITGTLFNGGTASISSMTLNWNVNNGTPNTMNVSSLNILPSTYYSYAHSVNWIPATNGTYKLKVWASNINGSNDQYLANDTLTQIVFVHTFQRMVLIEDFTQASCIPCAMIDPYFDSVLAPNKLTNKIATIRYHVAWPGYDPMYDFNQGDPTHKVDYYGIVSVPNTVVDGYLVENDCNQLSGYPGCLDQADIDEELAVPSIFEIQLGKTINGNILNVSVSVTAKTNIPFSNLRLRTAVIEDTITYTTPPGTNGETIFYQVLRKLLPDSAGTSLPMMSANQTLTYNYSWPIDTPCIYSELELVAFVQSDSTQYVFQSAISNPVPLGVAEETELNNALVLFPNPFSDHFTLRLMDKKLLSEDLQLELYDVLGKKVMTHSVNHSTFEIQRGDLPSGIYFWKVFCKNEPSASGKIIAE